MFINKKCILAILSMISIVKVPLNAMEVEWPKIQRLVIAEPSLQELKNAATSIRTVQDFENAARNLDVEKQQKLLRLAIGNGKILHCSQPDSTCNQEIETGQEVLHLIKKYAPGDLLLEVYVSAISDAYIAFTDRLKRLEEIAQRSKGGPRQQRMYQMYGRAVAHSEVAQTVNVFKNCIKKDFQYPAHEIAAKLNNVSTMKFLLELGKLPNLNAMYEWVKNSNADALLLLIQAGAPIENKTKVIEDQPLFIALQENYQIAQILVQNGASISHKFYTNRITEPVPGDEDKPDFKRRYTGKEISYREYFEHQFAHYQNVPCLHEKYSRALATLDTLENKN